MRLISLMLIGLVAYALPAAAQNKEPGLGPVFHQSLLACTNPVTGMLDMWSTCTSVRFGVIEAYLGVASICVETRSENDCAQAKKLEDYIRNVLTALSKR